MENPEEMKNEASEAPVPIRRALISAWCKEGLVPFARGLADLGVELLSTGGTARLLREAGLPVRDVSDLTGFPEMMGGRVKTLHPKVHGGLLFLRDDPEHVREAEAHGIPAIDLVYIDLYPFQETLTREGATEADVIEMIDIGGPAMIRSAAKNHASVLVVTDAADLEDVLEELRRNGGASTAPQRRRLAAKAFRRTAAYDALIAAHLTEVVFPERLTPSLERAAVTRYGENPHQQGAMYRLTAAGEAGIAQARQVGGAKALSYNNYLDASAALDVVRFLDRPAAAVVKHRNPCGAGWSRSGLKEAFQRALEGDPLSAFGGILAFNRPVSEEVALLIADPTHFIEVVVAPVFEGRSAEIIAEKVKWGRNCRLLEVGAQGAQRPEPGGLEFRSISGGVLVQERDASTEREFEEVTSRAPTAGESEDLILAWEICRNVISNAIVFVREGRLVGVGAGQMSRVDAVEMAARKAGVRARGAVMASDAFFPFADGVEAAAEAGVTAVVQPGGSRRDAEVIAACDAADVAMVFAGHRHFKH